MAQGSASNSLSLKTLTILQSLNSGQPAYDPKDIEALGFSPRTCDIDVLDFDELIGVSVNIDPTGNAPFEFQSVELDGASAPGWLQEAYDLRASGTAPLKLLWAQQCYLNDCFRSRQSIPVSKKHITRSMGLHDIMIEKMGTELPWTMNWPRRLSSKDCQSSYGVSSGHLSATWSYDSSTKTTYAFVVAMGSANLKTKMTFLDYLENMKDFSPVPAYLPYAIASLEVFKLTQSAIRSERSASDTDLHLIRMLYQRKPIDAFTGETMQVQSLLEMRKFTPYAIEMAKRSNFTIPHSHNPNTITASNQPCCIASDNDLLLDALAFRGQELTCLLAGAEALHERATHHMSSILGMISFHQQSTAQKISEATLKDSRTMKEIAEATKKDSTSMKVLALVTVIFLPSTTVSAILAIPSMFDFDSSMNGAWLVNPNFWIFLAISIPLTLIIVISVWFWLKWEGRGRPLPWFRSSNKPLVSEKGVDATKIV